MIGNLGNPRDIGAGARQNHLIDARHIGGDERHESADIRLLCLVEGNDHTHTRRLSLVIAAVN
jgi:hypothetical protein